MSANTQRKLGVEFLESREVMAGDVSAFLMGGDLVLNEAPGHSGQNNAVEISQLANGKIRVTGLQAADGGVTKINGQAFADFTVAGGYQINLGQGTQQNYFKTYPGVVLNGSWELAPGDPPPSNADNDYVYIHNVNLKGSLNINTGRGNDTVLVDHAILGDNVGWDSVNIETGAGADSLTMKNSTVNGRITANMFTSLADTEADVDNAWFQNLTITGDMEIRQGYGNDYFTVLDTALGEDIYLDASAGTDVAKIQNVTADELLIEMGAGNDNLTLPNVTVEFAELNGGGGNSDRLNYSGLQVYSTFQKTGWEWLNGQNIYTGGGPIGGGIGLARA